MISDLTNTSNLIRCHQTCFRSNLGNRVFQPPSGDESDFTHVSDVLDDGGRGSTPLISGRPHASMERFDIILFYTW